jgi:hypothetical protein
VAVLRGVTKAGGARGPGEPPMLTPEQAETLRAFARTHTGLVAFGTFEAEGCGCPLTETGIKAHVSTDYAGEFYTPYDRYIQDKVPGAVERICYDSPAAWRVEVVA